MSRLDGAGWLLAGAVRLLPAERRQWGAAMRAELAGIEQRRARWGFVSGCVRVIATRPATVRRIGYPLLMAGVLAATLWWTSRIAYRPLHWGSVTAVVVLLAVAWLGRRPGPLGPVAQGWTARGVRAGGYLLVAGWAVALTRAMAGRNDAVEQARYGLPIFGTLLTGYLIGFLTLTARRSIATTRVLVAGLAGGGAAAVTWTVAVVGAPPIPVEVAPVVVLIAVGMVAAASIVGRGGSDRRLLAALHAGTVASVLVFSVVGMLSTFGPAVLIPDLAPAALTPADDLAQSRVEIQDPYLWIWLLGAVIAALQSAAAFASRRPAAQDL